jgi:hypothetical protein
MTPIDQTDRDWSRGNCFYVTLEFIKDSEQLRAAGYVPKNSRIYLVHGLLDSERKKVRHAWVEIDDQVLDHSNNQKINDVAKEYYSANSALPVRRFNRAEADALLVALKGKDGELPICYWGDLSDRAVLDAMKGYREAEGIFASDVVISDPSDPANHNNLIFNAG